MEVKIIPHRQVAALPFQMTLRGPAKILLVTSRESRRWVIPKGWPMAGRSDPDAAAREAFEEAGVTGLIHHLQIGDYSYFKRGKSGFRIIDVSVYPLEVYEIRKVFPERGQREARWVSTETAAELVLEPGLSGLLRDFEANLSTSTLAYNRLHKV